MLCELRLEFIERLIEHGHSQTAEDQLRSVIGHEPQVIQLQAALQTNWLRTVKLLERLEPTIKEIETEAPGAIHLADAYETLAGLNNQLGRYKAALQYTKLELPIRTIKLGPNHPDTLTTRNNIAYWTDR